MKNISFALITLLLFSCTKNVDDKQSSTPLSSVQVSNAMIDSTQTMGRQFIITVPTGDFTYPVSKALLWLPKNYSTTNKKFPLIINLYGQGQNGYKLDKMIVGHTMSEVIADGFDPKAKNSVDGKTYQFMVFSPQCPVAWGWSAPQIKVMLQTLEDSFRVDKKRIYLTGFSSGGWGLWSCITDDTILCSKFAAISPMSSAPGDHPEQITNVGKYGIACWNICGDLDADYSVAVDNTDSINAHKPPIPAKLETLPGVRHVAWVYGYNPTFRPEGKNLYEWLIQYHK
jgi:putative esterase